MTSTFIVENKINEVLYFPICQNHDVCPKKNFKKQWFPDYTFFCKNLCEVFQVEVFVSEQEETWP